MKFCGACGSRVGNICNACSFENPPSFRFCGDCGTALTAEAAVASAPPGASDFPTPRTVDAGPPPLQAGAERRQVTVMFCDIVESTALADRLDAEEYREIVREYQARCSDVVHRYEGFIAQYLGDGILVYFGYPLAHEDDARRATQAALDIIAAVLDSATDRGHVLQVRIGIHTGQVVAGEVGAGGTRERLAMGSTPNVASRLESLATPNSIVISSETARLLQGWFELEPLGAVQLKGLSRERVAYRVLRVAHRSGRFELDDARRLSTLVGRDSELTLLSDKLECAMDGEGSIVLLSGEAGVGKSRLVQEIRDRALKDGFDCLIGRCSSMNHESSMLPMIELLEGMLGFESDSPPEWKLERLEKQLTSLDLEADQHVPLLAALMSVPYESRFPNPGLLPQKQKTRIFESLILLLTRLAAKRPTVMVVEDLHWSDPSTVEFLTVLVSEPPIAGLFILFTVRSEQNVVWAARSHVSNLKLSRLSDRDVKTLIESLTSDSALSSAMMQKVIDKTDGIPVFVEELTRMVIELQEAGEFPSVNQSDAKPFEIPETLQDSLLARLDRLGAAREIAQVGAVIGRVFSYGLLMQIADLDEKLVTTHLAQLVEAELLYQRGVIPSATFTFKHALLQDAAYSLLLRSARRELHSRVATAMIDGFASVATTQPELIAHHLTESSRTNEAIQYWLRAGMMALQRSATVEAVSQLNRGLGLLGALPDSSERDTNELALLTSLGAAYAGMMGYAAPQTVETFERASALSEKLGETPELFWATRGVWSAQLVCGKLSRSLDFGERCLRIAVASGRPDLRMEAHYTSGASHMFCGNLEDALTHFRHIRELEHPDRDMTGRMYTAIDVAVSAASLESQTMWLMGLSSEASEIMKEAMRLAEGLRHPSSLAFAHNQASWLAYAMGDRSEVAKHAKETVRLSEEFGLFFAPIGALYLSWTENDAATIAGLIQRICAGGSNVANSHFYSLLADAYRATGDLSAAEDALEEGIRWTQSNGEFFWEPELHRMRGELAHARGRTEDAHAHINRALESARSLRIAALELRAHESLQQLQSQLSSR